jgi:hypothetical protein
MSSVFLFRANGLAVTGRVSRPVAEVLQAQGASVLAPIGGDGMAALPAFTSPSGAVRFQGAVTTVAGHVDAPDRAQSTVNVVIRGLDLGSGLVTADGIDLILNSDHVQGQQAEITPNVAFDNLRILGQPIVPTRREVLFTKTTYPALLQSGLGPVEAGSGWISTSLYLPLPPDDSGLAAGGDGCSLRVPGRGTVYLGEYLVNHESRRLSLLRVELEGTFAGSLVVGYAETNGHWYP